MLVRALLTLGALSLLLLDMAVQLRAVFSVFALLMQALRVSQVRFPSLLGLQAKAAAVRSLSELALLRKALLAVSVSLSGVASTLLEAESL
jgi:hypothetical protein